MSSQSSHGEKEWWTIAKRGRLICVCETKSWKQYMSEKRTLITSMESGQNDQDFDL
jgi:hypothetical protein